jgi:ElaB/YqjD/DUF883 family membrane-anchored ribosome-binding protein
MTMSENYGSTSPGGTGGSGTVDTAKQEAKDLSSTAASEAGNVVGSAKEQAASVAHEVKSQAKSLYHQTTHELSHQAGAQQQRLADGLRTVGDQLGSMADSTDQGLASELVQQVSQRVGSAASWLGDRDPAAVLDEVKRYARRKPGTFIAVAAVAGVVVGRLTRALTSAAADEKAGGGATSASALPATAAPVGVAPVGVAPVVPAAPPVPPAPAAPVADTPLYRDLSTTSEGELPGEGNRV